MFRYVRPGQRLPAGHPVCSNRTLMEEVRRDLSPRLGADWATCLRGLCPATDASTATLLRRYAPAANRVPNRIDAIPKEPTRITRSRPITERAHTEFHDRGGSFAMGESWCPPPTVVSVVRKSMTSVPGG